MNAQDLLAETSRAVVSSKLLLDADDADGACNGAYFAMFDAARAALLVSGVEVGKTHEGLMTAFADRLVKSGLVARETGRLLKRAETFRNVADYAAEPVAPDEARELVQQAEAFVAALRERFFT